MNARTGSWRWLWPSLALLVVAAPLLFWDGGVVDEEALNFLRNFWDGQRSPLQRILELRALDFYQGRELSYAIDFLDAQWVRLLLGRGAVLFAPPSVVLASLLVVAAGLWLVPRALPGVGRDTAWLVLLLYLSNFAVASTSVVLYRATKPLVAALLIVYLPLLLAEHRRPRLRPWPAFALSFALGLAMSLIDRQGLFYLLLLVPILGAAAWRSRRGAAWAAGAAAAVLAFFLYNHVLGPRLIHAVNGYWPNMRFQRMRPAWLLDVRAWLDAAHLLLDWTRVLLGGMPVAALLVALAALAAALAWRGRHRPARLILIACLVAAATAAQTAMLAIMVVRHPPVTWVDHRYWYYPLPYQAVLVFLTLLGLERLASATPRVKRWLPLLLGSLVVLNLAQWPARRRTMEAGPWYASVAHRSALLTRSLRAVRIEPSLDYDYRRFFFECLDLFPALGTRAGPRASDADGFEVPAFQDGRLVAWAIQPEAHVVVTAVQPGPHVLAGRVRLRAGQRVQVLLGTRPRRQLAEIVGDEAAGEGQAFRVVLELPAAPVDIVLHSPTGPDPKRFFALELPLSVSRGR